MGLRAGHLKELIAAREQQNSGMLLRAMCSVVIIMVKSKVPDRIVPVLYGANLFPLRKKDGGIRPIAVGTTWRRIASKIVSKRSLSPNTLLTPLQVGFATKNGFEAAVHACRAYIEARRE